MIDRLIKILIELVNTPSDVIKSDLYTEMDDIIINIPEDEVNCSLINYILSKVIEETGGIVSTTIPITRFITTSFSTKSKLTKECIKDINNMTPTYQTMLSKIIDNRGNEIPELVSIVEFSRSRHYLLLGKNRRERLFVRRDNILYLGDKEVIIRDAKEIINLPWRKS